MVKIVWYGFWIVVTTHALDAARRNMVSDQQQQRTTFPNNQKKNAHLWTYGPIIAGIAFVVGVGVGYLIAFAQKKWILTLGKPLKNNFFATDGGGLMDAPSTPQPAQTNVVDYAQHLSPRVIHACSDRYCATELDPKRYTTT